MRVVAFAMIVLFEKIGEANGEEFEVDAWTESQISALEIIAKEDLSLLDGNLIPPFYPPLFKNFDTFSKALQDLKDMEVFMQVKFGPDDQTESEKNHLT